MCIPFEKHPGFNKIEIIAELEAPLIKQVTMRAVKGNSIRELSSKKNSFSKHLTSEGTQAPSSMLIRKLPGNLLVISFYSKAWRTYGLKYFRELDELKNAICILGGQLMITGFDESSGNFDGAIGDYSLNLHFYFDPAEIVMDKFRIYTKSAPVRDDFCGGENNIQLLAHYIIDDFYRVLFSLVDVKADIQSRKLRYA